MNASRKSLAIYERQPIATWIILVLLSATSSYVFAWDSGSDKWLRHAGMLSAIILCMVAYCITSKRLLTNQQRALHRWLVWVVLVKAVISLLGLVCTFTGIQTGFWLLVPDIYAGSASLWIVGHVLDESVLFFFHFITTLVDAALHSVMVWVIALILFLLFSKKSAQ